MNWLGVSLGRLLSLMCLLHASLGTSTPEEIDLIINHAVDGSFGGWRVGRACESCPRGVVATRPYEAGELVGNVKLEHCIDLGNSDNSLTSFIDQVLLEPDVNATFSEYLTTLPSPGELTCYITMLPEHTRMLQSETYSQLIREYDVYVDTITNELNERGVLNWTVTSDITRHYLALVTTRAFEFHNDDHDELHSYMCPLLDLLNHKVPGNVRREESSDASINVIAVENIQKGDELFWPYHVDLLARPDIQLLVYGFVEVTDKPFLSGIDEPNFDADSIFNPDSNLHPTFTDEEAAVELGRVTGILSSLPTTEEEDLHALESGQYNDFTEEAILKWRAMRKRALRQRIETLQKQLGLNIEEL